MHKIIITLIIFLSKTLVFIQINRCYSGKIQVAFVVPIHQLGICPDRRGTRSKPQHAVRFHNNLGGDNICRLSAHVIVVFCFDNFHFNYHAPFSIKIVHNANRRRPKGLRPDWLRNQRPRRKQACLQHFLHFISYKLYLSTNNNLYGTLTRPHNACHACRLNLFLIYTSVILDFKTKPCDAVVKRNDI